MPRRAEKARESARRALVSTAQSNNGQKARVDASYVLYAIRCSSAERSELAAGMRVEQVNQQP
jgi:hypothetical protein